jgi:hypothetical protein
VKTGQAMAGGDFPIPDARHLAAAKSEYRKGNYAGHSAAEVRAHQQVREAARAARPGRQRRDEVQATFELAAAGGDSASAVIARHPELRHLFKGGKTSSRKHPARVGKLVTTGTRAHSSDLDEDPSDGDQPGAGGAVHAEVDRYLAMRESQPGGEAGHYKRRPGAA